MIMGPVLLGLSNMSINIYSDVIISIIEVGKIYSGSPKKKTLNTLRQSGSASQR